jgi:hypothetical protein
MFFAIFSVLPRHYRGLQSKAGSDATYAISNNTSNNTNNNNNNINDSDASYGSGARTWSTDGN